MCCIPIYFSTTLKKGLDEWTQANSSKTYLKDSVHPAQGSVIQYLVYEHVYFARYSHFLALPIAWTSRSQPSSILEFRQIQVMIVGPCSLPYSLFLAQVINTESVLCSCVVSKPELAFALLVQSTSMSHHLLAAHIFRRKQFHRLQLTFKERACPISLLHKHSHIGSLDHLNVVHGRFIW